MKYSQLNKQGDIIPADTELNAAINEETAKTTVKPKKDVGDVKRDPSTAANIPGSANQDKLPLAPASSSSSSSSSTSTQVTAFAEEDDILNGDPTGASSAAKISALIPTVSLQDNITTKNVDDKDFEL